MEAWAQEMVKLLSEDRLILLEIKKMEKLYASHPQAECIGITSLTFSCPRFGMFIMLWTDRYLGEWHENETKTHSLAVTDGGS